MIPCLLLGFVELGLRLAGYGYSPLFFKAAERNGEAIFVENDQFGLRFFPPALARIPAPAVMKAVKGPKSFRIFILGESAALGDPRPNYSAARYMQMLLRERFPGREFEVVNTAMTAINSHAILPIARECAAYQGDFWIIYMGNNEMVGPYGPAGVAGSRAPPLRLIRTGLALQRLRTGQLLMACGRKLFQSRASSSGWKGMEMFLKNEILPQDGRRKVVYGNFRQNLDDIIKSGVRSGAKIVLNTVAVNLKDCPPFGSADHRGLSVGQSLEKADPLAAPDKHEPGVAAELDERAEKQSPDSAAVQFRLGDHCLRLDDVARAERHFQQAVDLDTLPFRADSRINGMLRDAARRFAGPNLVLCDAAAILGPRSSTRIAGQEYFYEHVHLNFDGNSVLGSAWAREIEQLLPPEVRQEATNNWPSQETCERRLGLTDWNRLSTIEEIINRLNQPPFTSQTNNPSRLQALRDRLNELKQATSPDKRELASALYREALEHSPEDFCVHENFAEFLEATGDLRQAASEWEKTRSLIPHYYLPIYNLGIIFQREADFSSARDALLKAAALNPNNGDIQLELGVTSARQGAWEAALQYFAKAHSLDPDNPRQFLYSGEMLWKLGRRAESIQAAKEALRLQPDYWQAHYRLGEELAQTGEIPGAAAEFRETLRINPSYVKAHENLGVALYKLGRNQEAVQEFDETLRLDPVNRQALEFKRQAQNQIRN